MKTHEAEVFCEETERDEEENVDDDDYCHWFVGPDRQFPRLTTINSEGKENVKDVRSYEVDCAALGLSKPSSWKSNLDMSVWSKRSAVYIVYIRSNQTS